MTKKEKFLEDINKCLDDFGFIDKSFILEKYNDLIDNKLKNNIKITKIIQDLNTPKEIAYDEIKKYNKNEKYSAIIEKMKSILNIFNKNVSKNLSMLKNNINKKIKKPVFNNYLLINKKKKSKKIIINKVIKKTSNFKTIVLGILSLFLYVLLFYFSTLFVASLFALLDHVKIYGIVLLLLSLVLFTLFFMRLLFLNKKNVKVNKKKNFIVFICLVLFMSFAVAVSLYNYFKIEFVGDVSGKYSMNFRTVEYKLPKKGKKLYLYFNNWYKTNYIIEYDETLKERLRIDLKYYESFYDLNIKNETGNIYLSLSPDKRDLISLYLNNLKDNKIYNEKELSRYIVKIYINELDKERLVIYD